MSSCGGQNTEYPGQGHLREQELLGFRAYDTLVGAEQLVAVKTASRHEVPATPARHASVVLTDSRAQAARYPEPHIFAVDAMVDLGSVLAGAVDVRAGPDQITVFSSVGPAGTEVALLPH